MTRTGCAVLLAGLTVLAGCTVHPTPAELADVPGADASYPGSDVYLHVELAGDRNLMATNPSSLRTVACADATPEQVSGWFDDTLTGTGWTKTAQGEPAPLGGYEPTADRWTRGDRSFVLRIFTPGSIDSYARAADRPDGCTGGYETFVR